MQKHLIPGDIQVYGFEVPGFPDGIVAAFDRLIATIPERAGRPCFGLSRMKENGDILYIAAIEQKEENEAAKNNCNSYTIQKGEYLCIALHDWMKRIESIKDAFGELMRHPEASHDAWCIEWYQSDDDMLCLLETKKM